MESIQTFVHRNLCALNEADVAFFPIKEISVQKNSEYRRTVNLFPNERILGIANLPAYFCERLERFQKIGTMHHPTNKPLQFSFLTRPCKLEDYWIQLMNRVYKSGHPDVWILGLESQCQHLLTEEIRGTGMFYYHDTPPNSFNRYLITEQGSIIRPHNVSLAQENSLN